MPAYKRQNILGKFVITVLCLIGLSWPGRGQPPYDRAMALQAMDGSVGMAKLAMNNPVELETLLIWDMARPAGDDPRVLGTCYYVIDHSTTPRSIAVAADTIGFIAERWHQQLPKNSEAAMASALRRAMQMNDFAVKSAVAKSFGRLGTTFEADRASVVNSLVLQYRGKVADHQLVPLVLEDESPWATGLISEVVDKSSDPQALDQIAGYFEEHPAPAKGLEWQTTILRRIVARHDVPLNIRIHAANALARKGGEYKDEAYRSYIDLLNDPVISANTSWNVDYIQLIGKVMDFNRVDSGPTLRAAIASHRDAINDYYGKILRRANKKTKQYSDAQDLLKRTDAILTGK